MVFKTLICEDCRNPFQVIGNHKQNQGTFRTLCKECRDNLCGGKR